MIKVGQKVRINPFKDIRSYGMVMTDETVDGVVWYVHPTHQYFTVEYDCGNGLQKISYRFDDIGKNVKLVH